MTTVSRRKFFFFMAAAAMAGTQLPSGIWIREPQVWKGNIPISESEAISLMEIQSKNWRDGWTGLPKPYSLYYERTGNCRYVEFLAAKGIDPESVRLPSMHERRVTPDPFWL